MQDKDIRITAVNQGNNIIAYTGFKDANMVLNYKAFNTLASQHAKDSGPAWESAAAHFAGDDPVGKYFVFGSDNPSVLEVFGPEFAKLSDFKDEFVKAVEKARGSEHRKSAGAGPAAHHEPVPAKADALAQKIRQKLMEVDELIDEAETHAIGHNQLCAQDGSAYLDTDSIKTSSLLARNLLVQVKDATLKNVYGDNCWTIMSRKEFKAKHNID